MEKERDFDIGRLHAVQLEILREFDRVCRANGLRYFLAYGTLLGAIRHNGFIPWDDDIDTLMPYEDYVKLQELPPSVWKKPYFLQTGKTDPEYIGCFNKVRDSDTTLILENLAHLDINHGVDIDIYPLIHLADDARLRKRQYRQTLLYMLLRVGEPPRNHGWALYLGSKAILSLLPAGVKKRLESRLLDRITRYQDQDTKESYVVNGNLETLSYRLENAWFLSTEDHPFENCVFPVPCGAREWLRSRYGDAYMQPPPEDLRGFKLDIFAKVDLDAPYTRYKGTYYCAGAKRQKVRDFRWVKFS